MKSWISFKRFKKFMNTWFGLKCESNVCWMIWFDWFELLSISVFLLGLEIHLLYCLSLYYFFQFGHFTVRHTWFTDRCTYAGEELNEKSFNIIEWLLSISETQACFSSGRHCIENLFFCSRSKLPCTKRINFFIYSFIYLFIYFDNFGKSKTFDTVLI